MLLKRKKIHKQIIISKVENTFYLTLLSFSANETADLLSLGKHIICNVFNNNELHKF